MTIVLGTCALLVPTAFGGELSWTFQRVEAMSGGASPYLSLSMRTGATWPTVFHESTQGSSVAASALTPTGWIKTSLDSLSPPAFLHSAAGTNGRVGAVWQSSNSNRIKLAQLTPAGWESSTVAQVTGVFSSSGAHAPDLAYLPGNRPVVAYSEPGSQKIRLAAYDGASWDTEAISFTQGSPTFTTGTNVSTAVNSQGNIGVAYISASSLIYAEKSLPGGTWSYAQTMMGAGGAKSLSLAYGPNDQVAVAALLSNGTLAYSWFDIQSGTWQNETLASSNITSQAIDLAFDAQGNPSLAYVVGGSAVHYRTKGEAGWLDYTLPTGNDPISGLSINPTSTTQVALALDRSGLPVLSYYTPSSGLILAYDPRVVPEPATLLVAGVGLGAIARRRRRG